MMPLGAMDASLLLNQFFFGIEEKNALAGIAINRFLPGAYFVVSLWTQDYLAAHAFMIADLGNAAAAELGNSFIVAQQVLADARTQLIAFSPPFRQKLFVLGGTLAGLVFLSLDFGGFLFHLC